MRYPGREHVIRFGLGRHRGRDLGRHVVRVPLEDGRHKDYFLEEREYGRWAAAHRAPSLRSAAA